MRQEFPTTLLELATGRGGFKTVRGGVDTYAGTTVIGEAMVRKLGLGISNTYARLQTVSGEPLTVSGVTSLKIRRGDEWVDLEAVVIPRLLVPDVDVLLGKNAHVLLGRKIHVDLLTQKAEYVGALTQRTLQDGNVIDTADFSAFCKNGVWNVSWKWKDGKVPDGAPKGPTVYKKGWMNAHMKETAFNELKQWLELKILSYVGEVQDHPDRGWLPINLVEQSHKATTPVRVAVDLKWLNRLIEYQDEFSKYEIASDKLREWRRMGEGYLCDLSKAFLRVRICDEVQRKFLTIRVGDSLYEINALPFGLSIAPRVLFEILNVVIGGLSGVSFFRDDIFMSDEAMLDTVLEALKRNGFVSKPVEKVSMDMVEPVKLLGLTVKTNVVNGRKLLWYSREEKFVGEHKVASGEELQSLTARSALGFLAALLPGMVPVASWLRPIVASLRSKCTKIATAEGWDVVVGDRDEIVREFTILKRRLESDGNPMNGRWELPRDDEVVRLYTDASDSFLGYAITDDKDSSLMDDCQIIHETSHANLGELDAVIFGIQACVEYNYRRIELKTDSTSVIGWLKSIVADSKIRVSGLYKKLIERRLNILRKMVREFKLEVRVSHVSGKRNLADVLTRVSSSPKPAALVGAVGQRELDRTCAFVRTLERVESGELTEVGRVVESLHAELLHPSPSTLEAGLRRLGFTGASRVVMESIRACSRCAEKRARLSPWKSTGKCWKLGAGEVFMDVLKISSEDSSYDGCITLVDAESRLGRIYPFTGSITSNMTITALADYITSIGGIRVIRTDNGSEFRNQAFHDYCVGQSIKHVRSSVSHPQSNGIVERFHRSLLNYIRVQYGSGLSWYRRALEGLRIYNRSPHSGLEGLTPLEAYHQVEIGASFSPLVEGEMVLEDSHEGEFVVEGVLDEEVFSTGQSVLWRDPNCKFKDKFRWKAGTVVEHRGRGAYRVKFGNKEKIVNRELLVAYDAEEQRTDDNETRNDNDISQNANDISLSDDGFVTPEEEDSPQQEQTVTDDETSESTLRRSLRNRRQPTRYRTDL